MITIPTPQKIIWCLLFLSPSSLHLLTVHRIAFVPVFVNCSLFQMKLYFLTQKITLAAPHLLAWSVAFHRPVKFAQKIPGVQARVFPHTTHSPLQREHFRGEPKLPGQISEKGEYNTNDEWFKHLFGPTTSASRNIKN
jgi:hypothetical protein